MTISSIAPVAPIAPLPLRSIRALDRKTGLTVNMVPSQSVAGKFHVVRTDRCDCRGFQARGGCRHLRAVQAERRPLADGGTAHLQVLRAAGSWPTVPARVAELAATYHSIFSAED